MPNSSSINSLCILRGFREGKQEGAALGYNPNRRGRNSHHPLMAFVGETKMVANAWLRPGNTAASSNCEAFMDETFEQALKGQKVGLVRADSGFYTENILNCLEARSPISHCKREPSRADTLSCANY